MGRTKTDDQLLSRREFLSESLELTAGLMVAGALAGCREPRRASGPAPAPAPVKPLGPNERINVAVVGLRNRGWELVEHCLATPNVHLRALCDVDGNILEHRANSFHMQVGYRPDTYQDLRDLLLDRETDAVFVATPTHWHALAAVWACQAGKHVYVEKPGGLSPSEGRLVVEAARRHQCLVQVGFHNRSLPGVRAAMAFLEQGGLGRLYLARSLCFKPRTWIGLCRDGVGGGAGFEYYVLGQPGKTYPQAYLENVDYDLWTGPAPSRPFNYNRFHYNWHWNWDYGGGELSNQGVHQLDLARWGLGKREHPVAIGSFGAYVGPRSNQETPNTLTASFRYADGTLMTAEVRGLLTNAEMDVSVGNFFYGTEGWMWLNGERWATFFGRENAPGPASGPAGATWGAAGADGVPGEGHVSNFLDALRTGRPSDLTCDVGEGYLSGSLPALANVSYRTGRSLSFDGGREEIVDNSEAAALLTRSYRKPFVIPA